LEQAEEGESALEMQRKQIEEIKTSTTKTIAQLMRRKTSNFMNTKKVINLPDV